jgi:hypothetical protein
MPDERSSSMTDDLPVPNSWTYRTREAVGVFDDPDAVDAVVNELEISGFDRASV